MNLNDHMTTEMLENLIDPELLKDEIAFCHSKGLSANKAGNISLPAISHNGNVVYAASCNAMDKIVGYWVARRDAARKMLNDDTHDKELGLPAYTYGRLK